MSRFALSFYQARTDTNIGTAFRSAYLYNAWSLATIGHRYKQQCSDTVKATRHVQYNHFKTFDEFAQYYKKLNFAIVAVELDEKSVPLPDFEHPVNAVYLMGNEVYGIHKKTLQKCDYVVQIPTTEPVSMNVSSAASIVMYDRFFKTK